MTPEEKLIEILKKHGIEMNIEGCGCCGSPGVSIRYNGEIIIKEKDYFNIEMIPKEELNK
jgi:hypothetical protein